VLDSFSKKIVVIHKKSEQKLILQFTNIISCLLTLSFGDWHEKARITFCFHWSFKHIAHIKPDTHNSILLASVIVFTQVALSCGCLQPKWPLFCYFLLPHACYASVYLELFHTCYELVLLFYYWHICLYLYSFMYLSVLYQWIDMKYLTVSILNTLRFWFQNICININATVVIRNPEQHMHQASH